MRTPTTSGTIFFARHDELPGGDASNDHIRGYMFILEWYALLLARSNLTPRKIHAAMMTASTTSAISRPFVPAVVAADNTPTPSASRISTARARQRTIESSLVVDRTHHAIVQVKRAARIGTVMTAAMMRSVISCL